MAFLIGPVGRYLILAVVLAGLWAGVRAHYIGVGEARANAAMQVKVDAQKAATDAANRQANENRIQAEKYHADLVAATTANYAVVSSRLRDLKAAIGGIDLSRAMEDSSLAGDPAALAGAIAEFRAAVGAFTDGVDRVAATCGGDAAQLGGILDLASRNGAVEGR